MCAGREGWWKEGKKRGREVIEGVHGLAGLWERGTDSMGD